jgi:hypothetical protein
MVLHNEMPKRRGPGRPTEDPKYSSPEESTQRELGPVGGAVAFGSGEYDADTH